MKIYSMINKKRKYKFKNIFSFFLIFFIVVLVCALFLKTFIFKKTYFDIVKKEATKNNLDPYIILSIIKTESKFNTMAISSKDAKGLMQIMDKTAEDINQKENIVNDISKLNIYDENINITLGCKYFKYLVDKYNGNSYIAICAYNAGMGNIDKWIKEGIIDNSFSEKVSEKIPFNETRKYLEKVIFSYNVYKILY